MGWPVNYGPRKCPACLIYFHVKNMVKIGRRYWCKRDAANLKRRMLRRTKPNGNGGR